MHNTTITQPRQIVEIMIVRHCHHYFYNRRVNGRSDVSGQPITRERAEQIYRNSADATDRIGSGPVGDFNPTPCEWSLSVRFIEALATEEVAS
jgi:hypothetical protein